MKRVYSLFLSLILGGQQLVLANSAFDFNNKLGCGVNLGNALEAPSEGDWGVVLDADYFKLIAEAGFNHVRIPVRWSSHADTKVPFVIESSFIDRVDWAIKQARQNGLKVVLNMHHYESSKRTFPQKNQDFWLCGNRFRNI